MGAAGSTWRPTKVLRVIEQLSTSTRTVKVETDAGIGFVKGLGNPSGPDSLACELVAGELAALVGLKTPEFALIEIGGLAIPMLGAGDMQMGPAFISREMVGETSDGSGVFLSKLVDKSAIARLIVFDTLIRNHDRCPPEDSFDEPNRDNLFFTTSGRKFDLVAFDHSHCFIDTTLDDIEAALTGLINEERVFGLFPEFRPHVREADIVSAVGMLRGISDRKVSEVLASLPPAWGVSGATIEALKALIVGRARKLPEFVAGQVLAQQRLGLEEE